MSFISRSALAAAMGIGLGLGLSLGGQVLADRERDGSAPTLSVTEARLFAEVLESVRQDYVDSVHGDTLIHNAIRGMVSRLDPYSAFLDAEEYRQIRINTSGNYTGVGLEVNVEDGRVVVVSPIDETPAYRAGILPGDILMMVDGRAVEQNLEETIRRMRGAPGTTVRLTVARNHVADLLHFDLIRERIEVASVRASLLEPGFGYVRVTHFSENTARGMTREVLDLMSRSDGLRGLVLDMRNNPGGVLDAAVAVSDSFLEDGEIVSANGRARDAKFSMRANAGDISAGAPIVVLVNGGTASASEIVAGALRDNDRAVIMGSTTFGKGSVQTVTPLSNGNAVKLTTSRYYTPSGQSIHEVGITPDIPLEATGNDSYDSDAWLEEAADALRRDYQLRQALAHLKSDQTRQSASR